MNAVAWANVSLTVRVSLLLCRRNGPMVEEASNTGQIIRAHPLRRRRSEHRLVRPEGLKQLAFYGRISRDRDGTSTAISRQREDCERAAELMGYEIVLALENVGSRSNWNTRSADLWVVFDDVGHQELSWRLELDDGISQHIVVEVDATNGQARVVAQG